MRKIIEVICIHMPKMMFAVNVLLLDRDRFNHYVQSCLTYRMKVRSSMALSLPVLVLAIYGGNFRCLANGK